MIQIKMIALSLILISSACKHTPVQNTKKDIPSFIEKKISEISSAPVRNPPGSIWEYTFKGEKVYFSPSYCCDVMSDLYDKSGNLLCHPDGGIRGTGDQQCPDFFSERSDEKLIWKDPR